MMSVNWELSQVGRHTWQQISYVQFCDYDWHESRIGWNPKCTNQVGKGDDGEYEGEDVDAVTDCKHFEVHKLVKHILGKVRSDNSGKARRAFYGGKLLSNASLPTEWNGHCKFPLPHPLSTSTPNRRLYHAPDNVILWSPHHFYPGCIPDGRFSCPYCGRKENFGMGGWASGVTHVLSFFLLQLVVNI